MYLFVMYLIVKLREREGKGGPRKVTQRSFIDGGWWMVDILSLTLYTKFGSPTHHHRKSLNLLD